MANIERYQQIRDLLEERVKNGQYTLEQANLMNKQAFEKYCTVSESSDDKCDLSDDELVKKAADLVKDGKKMSKDLREELCDFVGCCEDKKDDDDDEGDEGEAAEESVDELNESQIASINAVNAYLEAKKCKMADTHPEDCDCEECKKKVAEKEKKALKKKED